MFTGDAGFLSEPPIVTVKSDRTHCEACNEALDPTVMHKCDGNKEYVPPVATMPDLSAYTGVCPGCAGIGATDEAMTTACSTCKGTGRIG